MVDNTINLSSFEVKVYLKKNNRLAFHFNTHLIFGTEKYFASSDLKEFNCLITLNNGEKICFNKMEKIVSDTDYDYSFTGKAKVIQLKLECITEHKELKNSVIEIEISFKFREYNYILEKDYIIKTYGILKIINNERNFEN